MVRNESRHTFGIMSEFVEATERLSEIRPAVSVFDSSSIGPGRPHCCSARRSRELSDAGFRAIAGGGPGIMEAVNTGACFEISIEKPIIGTSASRDDHA